MAGVLKTASKNPGRYLKKSTPLNGLNRIVVEIIDDFASMIHRRFWKEKRNTFSVEMHSSLSACSLKVPCGPR